MTSLLTRITCVSTVVCALIVQTLPATAVEVGATAGEFNVSSGNASYTLPIKVAPGRGGMQPDVALSYNSAAGNGIMGVGWNLSAVSAISRCPANLAQDGFISGITFGDKSRYCLDGERLIPVSGANGAVGTEYRTEIDGYSRIRSVGGSANNPAYFVVDTKAGHTMTFGLGNNAALAFAQGRLVWSVSEVNDTTGNNPIKFRYFIDGNQQHLKSVNYSNGEILIGYESREDILSHEQSGRTIKTERRVRNLTVYSYGKQVRVYTVYYKQLGLSKLSVIDKILECGSQNQCFNSIELEWTEGANTWQFTPEYTPPFHIAADGIGDLGARFVDVNGDGLVDMVYHRWKNSSTQQKGAYINTGSGWRAAPEYTPPFHIVADGLGDLGARFVDVNGDGLVDMVYHRWKNSSTQQKGAYINTGSGWRAAPEYTPPFHIAADGIGDLGARFVDVNGDGLVDMVYHRWASNSIQQKGAYINTGRKVLLASITGSFNDKTQLSYTLLTDKTVYTKGTGATYPVVDLQYPQYVVSSVTADDGIGGSISTNYHYEGLKAHVKGRGSYGFAKITETYPDTGKTQETWFDQSGFPFTGHVLRHTESYNGQLLNESTTEYSQDSYYAGVESVHAHRTVQRSYELDGSLISTVTSLSENMDAYGNVGTVTVITEGGGETFTQTTVSQYDNNTDNWHLGRLMEARTTHTTPQGDATPKLSRFTYDAHTGLLDSESIISTQTGETFQTTVYQYDSFGQKIAVTLRVPNHADRTSTTERDVLGRPTRSCNPLGLCETFEYNEQGLLATQTGPNGITTRWSYDGFQRKRLETRADGNQTRIDYYFANSNQCGERATFAHHCSVTESSGSPAVTVQFDNLGREVRKITTALNGLKVYHETEYNHLGEVYRVSRPYFLGDNIYWASTQYDAIGRVVEITEPGPHGSTNTINNRYNGLTTTTYNGPKQLAKTTLTNALGQTVRVEEEEGSSVEYRYTVDGQLLTTTVAGDAATTITLAYDERGRKISMDDPDMGYWTYAYDAYGQLIQQTDAKGQVVTMDYDQLGRLVRRQETEGITTWQYGDTSAPLGSIGKLLVESNGAVSKTYEYDHFGRTVATTHTIEGTAYTTRVHYDALGRVIKTDYPGGQDFYTENLYSELGFLHSVRGSRLRAETGDLSQLAPLILAATDLAESYETRAHTLRRIGQRYRAKLDDYRALLAIQTRAEAKYQADLKEAEKEAASQPLVSVQVPISVGDITIFVPGWRSQLVLPTRDPVPVPHLSDDLQADLNSQKSLLTESINNAKIEKPHVITLAPVNVNGISIFIPVENGQGVTPTQNLSSDEQTNLTASIGQNQTLSPAFLGHLNNTVIELENVIALLDQHIGSYTQLIEQITVLAEQTLAAADQSFHYTRSLENGAESYQAQTADTQHITYWQALDADASGRITAESYGNGIVNDYSYNTATGQLQVTHSGLLGSTAIRHIEYQYDAYNNVTLRDDLVNDIRETFEYDRLDRLTATHLVSERFISGGLDIAQTQNYDVYGNITYKSDVGHYQYTSGRPHAVSSAGNHQYHYDANGNMLEGDGRRFTWNSFNKPIHISKNGKSARFSYGLDRARYKKINHTGDTTWYVGGLYEKQVTDNGQHTRHQYYIYAAGNRVASHSVSSKEGVKTHYLHKDALGSIDTMTDADGQVVDRRSYDAWGKQRHFDWQGAGSLYSMRLLFTTRAYTDHESIEEVGLIHMNGRVYDASLARFVSADPHIQAVGMSQSYNRYSYVLNNPMKYTDPSGYFFKKLFKSIKKAVKKVVKAIKPFIGVIIAAVVTFLLSTLLSVSGGNAVALGALAGAAAGAASAAVNGGNILKGAITGGISGAIFAGIGVSGWGDTAKVLAHGVAGGFMSVVQGGKFGQGFLSAGFAKFATTNLTNGGVFNMADRSTGSIVGRTAVAAVVGGTASELGGGKFANGARTAAFLQITSEASEYYRRSVGQRADIRSGENRAEDPIYDPDKNGRQLPEDQRLNVVGFNDKTSICHQGGACSRVLNAVPGVNATARLHDYWFNAPDGLSHTTFNNVATYLPAAAISYAAIIGNLTQGWQNNPIVWHQITHGHRYYDG